MSAPQQQTVRLNAYMTEYSSLRGEDLHKATHDRLASGLHLTSHEFENPEYVLVGHAEVIVTLFPRAEAINRQVTNLRKQQKKVRAEAQANVNRIDREINSLLAIENGAAA